MISIRLSDVWDTSHKGGSTAAADIKCTPTCSFTSIFRSSDDKIWQNLLRRWWINRFCHTHTTAATANNSVGQIKTCHIPINTIHHLNVPFDYSIYVDHCTVLQSIIKYVAHAHLNLHFLISNKTGPNPNCFLSPTLFSPFLSKLHDMMHETILRK